VNWTVVLKDESSPDVCYRVTDCNLGFVLENQC
jgi:hypothetical protein